jgi:hypothetical protein
MNINEYELVTLFEQISHKTGNFYDAPPICEIPTKLKSRDIWNFLKSKYIFCLKMLNYIN